MEPTLKSSGKGTEEISAFLNTLIADEYVLYTKTRNAHFNVNGPGSRELHRFLKIQYGVLELMIDGIAERVRSLGHFALGSLKDFLWVTQLSEEDHDFSNTTEIIQTLVADHETIISTMSSEIITISSKYNDYSTADFVTGLIEQHEKMTWMLNAFLKEPDFSATKHINHVANQLAMQDFSENNLNPEKQEGMQLR